MNWIKKLHWQIIIGLILGLLWGITAPFVGLGTFTVDYIKPIGTIFIRLLQLVAVPLVLASLILGVTQLNDLSRLSRIGGRTITVFIITTMLAIATGLAVVNLINPGNALSDTTRDRLLNAYSERAETRTQTATEILDRSPLQPIVDLVPENFFAAASDNTSMLQVLIVAIFTGAVLMQLPRGKAQPLIDFFSSLNEVIMRMITMIMKLAPPGAFALIAAIFVELAGTSPIDTLRLFNALGLYGISVLIGLFIHWMVVYHAIVRWGGGISFIHFVKQMRPAFLVAFSTSSSNATLPVTMDCVYRKLNVREEISSFVLPLGATVNMDGTSLYQAVATVFIAQALGLEPTFAEQASIVFTATLASIGTAGVPGAGIIMLVIVLQSINVPLEGIALILGIDRILDMIRTVVNVTGDAAVAVAINRLEEQKQTGG